MLKKSSSTGSSNIGKWHPTMPKLADSVPPPKKDRPGGKQCKTSESRTDNKPRTIRRAPVGAKRN